MDYKPIVYQRIAAHAISQVFQELGFGQLAFRFLADDPLLWIVPNEGEVRIIRANSVVGAVELLWQAGAMPYAARVVFNDVHDCIRDQHLDQFEPAQYGLRHHWQTDYKGDSFDDIDATVTFEGDLESTIIGLFSPPKPVPKSVMPRSPRCRGSLGGSKHGR